LEAMVLSPISLTLSWTQLEARLAVSQTSSRWNRIEALANQALSISGPGGAYLPVAIDEMGDGYVVAAGVHINSRILQEQTERQTHIFPFLVTCGQPLAAWAQTFTSLTDRYVADVITEIACLQALETLISEVDARYGLANGSMINPGSLEDWPLEGQLQIFQFLREPARRLGISLSKECLMSPLKSMSGIRFSGKTRHQNCSHCSRDACIGRRHPFENPS